MTANDTTLLISNPHTGWKNSFPKYGVFLFLDNTTDIPKRNYNEAEVTFRLETGVRLIFKPVDGETIGEWCKRSRSKGRPLKTDPILAYEK